MALQFGIVQLFNSFTIPRGVKAVGVIWFLMALYIGSLYWEVIVKYIKNRKIIVVFLGGIWLLTIAITSKFCLPFAITNGVAYCVWLFWGTIFSITVHKGWVKSIFWRCRGIIFVIWFFIVICEVIQGDFYYINNFRPPLHGLEILGAFAGIFSLINLSCIMWKKFPFLSKKLKFLGEHSLEIMCVHAVDIEIIDIFLRKYNTWFWNNWIWIFIFRTIFDVIIGIVIVNSALYSKMKDFINVQ